MKTVTSTAPILLFALFFLVLLPSAHAAPKAKVTVATLAATYTCGNLNFSDPSETEVNNLNIVVSRSGAISGTGIIRTTDPACEPLNEDGIDCTTERSISFTMAKLAAPKKKFVEYQSSLKRKIVDAASGLSLGGTVKTFFSSVRYRSIEGVASLGTSANSLTATLTCSAPNTLK
jgi:hypothetical protein